MSIRYNFVGTYIYLNFTMKRLILSSCVLGLIGLFGCHSTKIISAWREPNKEISFSHLGKVLVVALFQNETSRRKSED
jgi:hypothetical protein